MYYVFIFVILVTILLLQFLLNLFNNSTQRLASVATSVVRDHQFSTIHLCGLSLVRRLTQFFELGTNNRMSPRSSTEYGHSGLKCAQRRAPASRYIVAFFVNTRFLRVFVNTCFKLRVFVNTCRKQRVFYIFVKLIPRLSNRAHALVSSRAPGHHL